MPQSIKFEWLIKPYEYKRHGFAHMESDFDMGGVVSPTDLKWGRARGREGYEYYIHHLFIFNLIKIVWRTNATTN